MSLVPATVLRGVLAVALIAAAAGVAAAQEARQSPQAQRAPDDGRRNFKCSVGSLDVRLDTREDGLVAVVFPERDVSYTLPVMPWTPGGPAQVTWSDGRRTLVWLSGVELHWTDGASERVCVNGAMRHEHG